VGELEFPGQDVRSRHTEMESGWCHDQALADMCDELCRLTREVRRFVLAGRTLASLGSLTAVEPLRNLLVAELQTRLHVASTICNQEPAISHQGQTVTESVPGYL